MAVIIFLAVLFVLILVHEWGHFIAAKKVGMRVDEFAIGFPPRLFGKKIGETLYSLNLFPIGGYVKIWGENGEEESSVDDSRSFSSKPKWAQAVVLVAGVVMNVLLAYFLFVAALTLGTQSIVSEELATDEAALIVTEVVADGPGNTAGIPAGARIVRVTSENQTLSELTPSGFQNFVATHQDGGITVTYLDGKDEQVAVVMPKEGVIETEPRRAAVGVALALIEKTSLPLPEAVIEAASMTIFGLRDIAVGIGGLLWDAVRFEADFSDVAGPIGIVGLVGEATAFGFTTLLLFTAFISLNLAVINVLPFPALDGGRLLFVLIEAIKGSPIKSSFAGALNTFGFLLLMLLMLAVTYSDIAKLF